MKIAIALHGGNKISTCTGKTMFCLVFALLFLTGIAAVNAQEQTVTTVMLATDVTSVDASVAAAAAAAKGIPVLIAENGLLTDEIKTKLTELGVKTVILVGGPVVIKPEAERELQSLGYTTIRLWGIERTGTAIAVARYFWPEGSGCAVLVDDTKNSDADARRQWAASNLAAKFNCTLIPVPEGTLPAEVLDLLKDLNVTHVKFVGKRFLIGEKLREFRVRALEGDDDEVQHEVEAEIENATARANLKLVIVATPDWKAAIAIGAHPNYNSVVRMITSENQTQALIDLIKEKNISDVCVVGIPELAQRVANILQQNGINATVVSGRKAAEIAAELVEKHKAEWAERHREKEQLRTTLRIKIKGQLNTSLSELEAELDKIEAELDASTANVSALRAELDAARAQIAEIKAKLAAGDLDGAQMLIARIMYKVREHRYDERAKLKIDINVEAQDEENELGNLTDRAGLELSQLEHNLAQVRAGCNNTALVEQLVEKARSFHTAIQTAREAGNWTGAAHNLRDVKELVELAHSIGERCREHGTLPTVASRVAIREGVATGLQSSMP
jgi:methylmalonyl-CoA mutase cobalamin-binding subunit